MGAALSCRSRRRTARRLACEYVSQAEDCDGAAVNGTIPPSAAYCTVMYLPKREELLLRIVFALPARAPMRRQRIAQNCARIAPELRQNCDVIARRTRGTRGSS